MEELQDAIEDAQYLSAVISKGGPKPTEKWVFPSPNDLEEFRAGLLTRNPKCFSLDNICRQILGFYMFREFCRTQGRHCAAKVSFLADVIRFKRLRSRTKRRRLAKRIIELYLAPTAVVPSGSSHSGRSAPLGNSNSGKSGASGPLLGHSGHSNKLSYSSPAGAAAGRSGSAGGAVAAAGNSGRSHSSPSVSMEEADLCRRPSPADVIRKIGIFEAVPEPSAAGAGAAHHSSSSSADSYVSGGGLHGPVSTPLVTSFGDSEGTAGSPGQSVGSDRGGFGGGHAAGARSSGEVLMPVLGVNGSSGFKYTQPPVYNTLLVRGVGVDDMLAALPSLADGAVPATSSSAAAADRTAQHEAQAMQQAQQQQQSSQASGGPALSSTIGLESPPSSAIGGVADLCASPRGLAGHLASNGNAHAAPRGSISGDSPAAGVAPQQVVKVAVARNSSLSSPAGPGSSSKGGAAAAAAVAALSVTAAPSLSGEHIFTATDSPREHVQHSNPRLKTILTSLHLDAEDDNSCREGGSDSQHSQQQQQQGGRGHTSSASSAMTPGGAASAANSGGGGSSSSASVFTSSKAFDVLEAWVFEQLRASAHEAYLCSKWHSQYLNYYYLQFQPINEDSFILFRVLGRGGFGAVNGCKRSTTGKLYAMKMMSRRRIKAKKSEDLCWNERRILEHVSSPFVVSLKYAFSSESDLFLILDLMTGGDLGFHLTQMGTLTYEMARYYTARMVLALDHLHSQDIVYRDLKPENVLLGEDGRSRISDMGLACRVTPALTGACGTRGYWAPEMRVRDAEGHRVPYNCCVDWFSLGCVLYEFLCGVSPFRTERARAWCLHTIPDKDKRIDKATMEMEPDWPQDRFSNRARDLCSRLLAKDPATRLGANGGTDIMSHPWFGDLDWDRLAQDQLTPPFVPNRDINAAPQRAIGSFVDGDGGKIPLFKQDKEAFRGWEYTSESAFQEEVVDFLRYQSQSDSPDDTNRGGGLCCSLS